MEGIQRDGYSVEFTPPPPPETDDSSVVPAKRNLLFCRINNKTAPLNVTGHNVGFPDRHIYRYWDSILQKWAPTRS